jgi:glucosamine--fructose-6-phosphate aminotransferase (isomerizing)
MCGIVAYTGYRSAIPLLMEGLKRLEYRGYDSAGIAIPTAEGFRIFKQAGKVSALAQTLQGRSPSATTGIAHTRWATHGKVNDINAHPHTDCKSQIAVAHNGIIENFQELKKELEAKGHKFISETDSEVVPHLIEEYYQGSLLDAVLKSVKRLKGSFALVILSSLEPDKVIGVKMQSPLLIGVGQNEMLLASDPTPLLSHTKEIVTLDDGEICLITQSSFKVFDFGGKEKEKKISQIEWTADMAEKGSYPHFMLKEIFEQPTILKKNLEYYIRGNEVTLLKDFNLRRLLLNKDRILIQASGTSLHAGLVGKYLLEKLARIQTDVDYSSEFRYREPVLTPNTLVIAISQSGETADTLAGVKMVKENGLEVLSIVNVKDSSIARESDYVLYINAGPEIGVASTKAYTAQILILLLLSLEVGLLKGHISEQDFQKIREELFKVPDFVSQILVHSDYIKTISEKFLNSKNVMFLGRGINYPTALEGALKLKEISYIHAIGYAAGEMKHGPLALVDKDLPVIFVNPFTSVYEKSINNLEEVKARGGIILSVSTEGDDKMKSLSNYTFEIPYVNELFTPIVSIVPLQLFSYYVAVGRGCDVDKPRNLAKSVTVE